MKFDDGSNNGEIALGITALAIVAVILIAVGKFCSAVGPIPSLALGLMVGIIAGIYAARLKKRDSLKGMKFILICVAVFAFNVFVGCTKESFLCLISTIFSFAFILIASNKGSEVSALSAEERMENFTNSIKETLANSTGEMGMPMKKVALMEPAPVRLDPMLRKYLKRFTPVVDSFVKFFEDFLQKDDVSEILRRHLTHEASVGADKALASLILSDLEFVSNELGHPVNLETFESCGFVMLMLRLRADAPAQTNWMQLLDLMYKSKDIDMEKMTEEFKSVHNEIEARGGSFVVPFLFADLLKSNANKYMRLVYDFSATLANIDGILTQQEVQWLQSLEKYIGNMNFKKGNVDGLKFVVPYVKSKNAPAEPEKTTDAKPLSKYQPDLEIASENALNSLVALDSVKKEVITFRNFVKIQSARCKRGLPIPPTSYHLVFSGNPGTGKTTIARIMAGILKDLGILSKGHLVEATRSDLVAGYVGQTAMKTNKVIDEALDGVLFIDEAYTLSKNVENDYGQEAIDTLLKRMEDDRDRLVVIIAGYKEQINSFVKSNPGLSSRFNRYIDFPDYTKSELKEIFMRLVAKYEYCMAPDAKAALDKCIEEALSDKDERFGNGRFVRNLFEKVIERQANRLAKVEDLTQVNISMLDAADF